MTDRFVARERGTYGSGKAPRRRRINVHSLIRKLGLQLAFWTWSLTGSPSQSTLLGLHKPSLSQGLTVTSQHKTGFLRWKVTKKLIYCLVHTVMSGRGKARIHWNILRLGGRGR
jgi:hypothetical protein